MEKVRIARARGKDHRAALLEVPNGAAADVRLGELLHADRRHDARVDALPLEHVLHGQRVDHRAEHAHVVGGDAVHASLGKQRAANDVAAADHQTDRRAGLDQPRRFRRRTGRRRRSRSRIPCSPARASPESLSRIRGYLRSRQRSSSSASEASGGSTVHRNDAGQVRIRLHDERAPILRLHPVQPFSIDLRRRDEHHAPIYEHVHGEHFTSKYNINRLVHFDTSRIRCRPFAGLSHQAAARRKIA